MAFLKIDKKQTGNYIRLIESYREKGKVRNRVIASLGKVEDYTPKMLRRMGEKLYTLGGGNITDLIGGNVSEIGRYNYGFVQAVNKGLTYYGLDTILTRLTRKHKLSYSLTDVVKLLLAERLNEPVSKLCSYDNQQEYLGLKKVELQHIYRSLNYLAKNTKLIQKQIFQTGRDLFNMQLDVVFYDVTTFYFSSEKEGHLRQKGFGKDGKIGKTQIVFGLLIDKDKNPVAYRLYKGSQYEGHTFEDAIKTLKQEYQIDKVIVVADRGMLSKHNIDIVSGTFDFIVGERLKSLPKNIQSKLLDIENYKQQWIYTKDDNQIKLKYQSIQYQGRTIISTYSEKRARKDAADREQRIEKAKKLLQTPSLINKKPSRYYLKNETSGKFILNQKKIDTDKQYDGFIAISTNNTSLKPEDVLDHYRHLFQIEQTFRSFKSHLEIRPMFHWNDTRIEGHIALCYIAYAIENHLIQKLKKAKVEISENKLRKALGQMQVSLIKQRSNEFYLRSNNQDLAANIINKLGLSKIPNLIPKDKITSYL